MYSNIIIIILVQISLIFGVTIQILFCLFLENGNRYNVEYFSVYLTFNGLSKNISHVVVVQNFIISTCLSKVLTINFLENGNRYKFESFW